MCICMCMGVHVCVHACRGQREIWGDFLCSPPYPLAGVAWLLHFPSSSMLAQFFMFAWQAPCQLSQLPSPLEFLLTMQYKNAQLKFFQKIGFLFNFCRSHSLDLSCWCLQMLQSCMYDWVMVYPNNLLLTYMWIVSMFWYYELQQSMYEDIICLK